MLARPAGCRFVPKAHPRSRGARGLALHLSGRTSLERSRVLRCDLMTTLTERVRARSHPTRETVLVAAGLLVIYFVWGSVYVAIRYVVEDVPALLSIGLRYVVAGLLLASYVAARRGRAVLRASRRAVLGCVLLAVL